MQQEGPEEHELIEREAESLAADHAVDVGRVREILESLVDAGWRGVGISYSPFHEAVERVGARDALRIFEEEDLDELRARVLIANYVANPFTPVYSLDRLGELTSALLEYLDRNRASLLQTGHPQSNFRRSPYLDWHLTRLYFAKVPFHAQEGKTLYEQGLAELRGDAEVDGHGDFVYEYEWVNSTSFRTLSPPVTVTYEEAMTINGLSSEDASTLEALRPGLQGLREAVVERLQEALQRRDSRKLFSDCINILSEGLSRDEARFLVDRDRFYDELSNAGLAPWSPDMRVHVLHSGGLSDLLSVIGHYEHELDEGIMDGVARSLTDLTGETWGAPPWYYEAAIGPERGDIDAVLDALDAVQDEVEEFRRAYRDRVEDALESEFRRNVTVTATVRGKYVAAYEPYLRGVAECTRAQQEATGELPSLTMQIGEASTPPAPKNVFRMRGNVWEVGLAGDDPVPMNDIKGMRYIAYLLGHPEEEFAALDLLRRVDQSWTPDSPERQAAAMDSPGMTTGMASPDPVADRESLANLDGELGKARADLLSAQQNRDSAREDEARQLIQKLEQVEAVMRGRRGRSRTFREDNERARTAVSKAIHRALKKMEGKCGGAHRHLKNSLRTGSVLSYKPEAPIDWEL